MAQTIHTTTGTAAPDELGRTLIHEHVLVGFPGWDIDAKAPRYKREEMMTRAVDQMQELLDLGVGTFVDPCPMDLGRDVEFLAELSQKSGMRIICTTGAYFEAEGVTYTFRHLPVEEITDIYVKEITEGVGDTGIRAGAVKIATGTRVVTEYERKLVTAGARAAKQTGVPVISHTQEATCGHDQIDLVTGEGVAAERLLVGHSDGTEDHWYQRSLAERGAFVGFDRFGISLFISDEVRIRNVLRLAEAGHTERIMLPNWRSSYIFREVVPKLREGGLSERDIETILVDNPRRFFGGA
jgi:phosphotriesterase-related protein